MAKETGGAAFPQKDPGKWDEQGMTLRDYFAAKAMAAYTDRRMLLGNDCATEDGIQRQFDNTANFAYRMADAMVEARKQ